MVEKKQRFRALVGLSLPSKDGEVRVEAGQLIPDSLTPVVPLVWVGRIVKEA